MGPLIVGSDPTPVKEAGSQEGRIHKENPEFRKKEG